MRGAHRPQVRLGPFRNGDELPLGLFFKGDNLVGRPSGPPDSPDSFLITVGHLVVNQKQRLAWAVMFEHTELRYD